VMATRRAGQSRLHLFGANDHLEPGRQIECLPTRAQCKDAVVRLAQRLNIDLPHAMGVYSRGGANATPLALPELLDVLVERLSGKSNEPHESPQACPDLLSKSA